MSDESSTKTWTGAHRREAFVRLCELMAERARADMEHVAMAEPYWAETERRFQHRLCYGGFDPARIDAEVALVRQRAETLRPKGVAGEFILRGVVHWGGALGEPCFAISGGPVIDGDFLTRFVPHPGSVLPEGQAVRIVMRTQATDVDRETLGREVRRVWIDWAREQTNQKPSWLAPWEDLTEPEREVDRRIGEALFSLGALYVDKDAAALASLVREAAEGIAKGRVDPEWPGDDLSAQAAGIAAEIAALPIHEERGLATERDVLKSKVTAIADELRNEQARSAKLAAELAVVKTDIDGVWRWQGDGYDHLESLACPVVMGAETLRSLLLESRASVSRYVRQYGALDELADEIDNLPLP